MDLPFPAPSPFRLGSPNRGNTLDVEGQPSEAEWKMVRKSAVEKSAALLEKHDGSIFSRRKRVKSSLMNSLTIPLERSRTEGWKMKTPNALAPEAPMSVHLGHWPHLAKQDFL